MIATFSGNNSEWGTIPPPCGEGGPRVAEGEAWWVGVSRPIRHEADLGTYPRSRRSVARAEISARAAASPMR
jgi:hypothetical protein